MKQNKPRQSPAKSQSLASWYLASRHLNVYHPSSDELDPKQWGMFPHIGRHNLRIRPKVLAEQNSGHFEYPGGFLEAYVAPLIVGISSVFLAQMGAEEEVLPW